jgi:hypothetical protein
MPAPTQMRSTAPSLSIVFTLSVIQAEGIFHHHNPPSSFCKRMKIRSSLPDPGCRRTKKAARRNEQPRRTAPPDHAPPEAD